LKYVTIFPQNSPIKLQLWSSACAIHWTTNWR